MTRKMQAILTKISQPKKSKIPVSLRTLRDEVHYNIAKKNGKSKPLVDETRLREWKYWALINNEFPYTSAFDEHHMLIPKRVVSENELSNDEKAELELIYKELGVEDNYDCRLINFQKKQSIKSHFHIHLLRYKDNRNDLKF